VLSKFDSVEIILKFKNGQAPVRIFHSKVKTRSEIDKLESPSYDGKFVTILISGYNAKKLVYQVEKQYNGAKGETDSTIQIVGADTGALILSAPTLSALNPGDTKMTLFWNLVSGAITYNVKDIG
jgi:hypothetical protein